MNLKNIFISCLMSMQLAYGANRVKRDFVEDQILRAIRHESTGVLDRLLTDSNFDVNIQTDYGTPLTMLLEHYPPLLMIKLDMLLEHPAFNVNQHDSYCEQTALNIVAMAMGDSSADPRTIKIFYKLVQAGAAVEDIHPVYLQYPAVSTGVMVSRAKQTIQLSSL